MSETKYLWRVHVEDKKQPEGYVATFLDQIVTSPEETLPFILNYLKSGDVYSIKASRELIPEKYQEIYVDYDKKPSLSIIKRTFLRVFRTKVFQNTFY